MKIKIWSDIMCPFCYIGKRKFEKALEQFEHKDEVEIEWKSFQLDPDLQTEGKQNIHEYLAERKGWTVEYAKKLNENVTEMAREMGLVYNFDKTVVANSFNAHKLIQLAKENDLGDKAEEALFRTYFTEGGNIDDIKNLIELGLELGLKEGDVKDAFNNEKYSAAVVNDINEARRVGVRGVPFFLIDNKYVVSGAQDPETFLEVLKKSKTELRIES